jgi:dipeptidyl aminopeptidase/acylaminoacyl peptidase
VTYVDASDPPMLFTHAMFDLISLATVEPMLDALADAGVEHDLVIAPGTGHSSSLAPDVADDTVQFLDAHLQEPEPTP